MNDPVSAQPSQISEVARGDAGETISPTSEQMHAAREFFASVLGNVGFHDLVNYAIPCNANSIIALAKVFAKREAVGRGTENFLP